MGSRGSRVVTMRNAIGVSERTLAITVFSIGLLLLLLLLVRT